MRAVTAYGPSRVPGVRGISWSARGPSAPRTSKRYPSSDADGTASWNSRGVNRGPTCRAADGSAYEGTSDHKRSGEAVQNCSCGLTVLVSPIFLPVAAPQATNRPTRQPSATPETAGAIASKNLGHPSPVQPDCAGAVSSYTHHVLLHINQIALDDVVGREVRWWSLWSRARS